MTSYEYEKAVRKQQSIEKIIDRINDLERGIKKRPNSREARYMQKEIMFLKSHLKSLL